MRVSILTLDAALLESTTVMSVQFMSADGEVEIRDQHEAVFGVIESGVIEVIYIDSHKQFLATGKGIFHVSEDNTLSLLCDAGVTDTELNETAIETARTEAEKYLSTHDKTDVEEYSRVQAILDLELAKMAVIRRKKNSQIR